MTRNILACYCKLGMMELLLLGDRVVVMLSDKGDLGVEEFSMAFLCCPGVDLLLMLVLGLDTELFLRAGKARVATEQYLTFYFQGPSLLLLY